MQMKYQSVTKKELLKFIYFACFSLELVFYLSHLNLPAYIVCWVRLCQ